MNFENIFSPAAQKYIQENSTTPIEKLLLGAKKYPELNIPLLVAQIEGRAKAQKKLPSWYANNEIVYPIKLSMEQCSSEQTAAYKASLLDGKSLIDLTGGFGVDCAAFAGQLKQVFYVERNAELANIAARNFKLFAKNNVEIHSQEAEQYITTFDSTVDWIFIDPARRKEGGKVFRFADCEPNILELKNTLFEKAKKVLIKTSPLLDIDLAIQELGNVAEVHVLSIENECKELLFLLDPLYKKANAIIFAVNIRKDGTQDTFSFTRELENEAIVPIQLPSNYLYEPNASILKAGAFKSIALKTGLFKLNVSSHLYTSSEIQKDFPGRIFKILKTVKYSKKDLMVEIPEGKANIAVRNFPDSVDVIRKKTGLKEGGSVYLFATKDKDDKLIVLLTEKII